MTTFIKVGYLYNHPVEVMTMKVFCHNGEVRKRPWDFMLIPIFCIFQSFLVSKNDVKNIFNFNLLLQPFCGCFCPFLSMNIAYLSFNVRLRIKYKSFIGFYPRTVVLRIYKCHDVWKYTSPFCRDIGWLTTFLYDDEYV